MQLFLLYITPVMVILSQVLSHIDRRHVAERLEAIRRAKQPIHLTLEITVDPTGSIQPVVTAVSHRTENDS